MKIREFSSAQLEAATESTRRLSRDWFQVWSQFLAAGRFRPVAVIVVGAGMLLIYLGVLYSGVWLGVIGFFLVAVGLYAIKDAIASQMDESPEKGRLWIGIGGALLAAAFLFVFLGLRTEWAPIVVGGVMLGVIGLLPLSKFLRLRSEQPGEHSGEIARRGRGGTVALLGLVALAIGIGLVAASANWFLGAAAVVGGLTLYRTGLTGYITADRFRWAAPVGLGGLLIGTVLVIISAETSELLLFLVGGLVGTLGAHLLAVALRSDAGEQWKKSSNLWQRFRRPVHWAIWLVLAATWLLIITVYDQPFAVGTALSLVVAGVGALFVWRGESMFTVLAVGLLVAWGAIDRDVEPSPDWNTGNGRILAIGDSYMSGEGAPLYLEGTNTKGSSPNQCRRAPTAYPMIVAEELGMDIQFLACSGAKAVDILHRAQMPDSPDDVPGGKAQIEHADWDGGFDYVLVSIGGNDASFSDVVIGCLLPGSCSDVGANFMLRAHDPIEGVRLTYEHRGAPDDESEQERARRQEAEEFHEQPMGDKLLELFQTVRAKAGEDTPVIVMPYPLMVTPTGCKDVMLTTEEHQFVTRFVELLNAQAQRAAARAGVHFFAGGRTAFVDDRLCSNGEVEPAAINFISVLPVEGSLVDRINPANWPHQSMHPNPTGHGRTAAALLSWLATDPPTANPQPKPDATFASENITVRPLTDAEVAELQESENSGIDAQKEWRNYVLSQAAKEAWPLVTILLLGGLFFAMTSIREPFNRPDDPDEQSSSQ